MWAEKLEQGNNGDERGNVKWQGRQGDGSSSKAKGTSRGTFASSLLAALWDPGICFRCKRARRRLLRIADVCRGHPPCHPCSISHRACLLRSTARSGRVGRLLHCGAKRHCVDIDGCRDLHSRIVQISTSANRRRATQRAHPGLVASALPFSGAKINIRHGPSFRHVCQATIWAPSGYALSTQ